MLDEGITVIGVGHMGAALVRGITAGVSPLFQPGRVRVIDRAPGLAGALAEALGVVACDRVDHAVAGASVVLLCVKPQSMPATLAELEPHLVDGAIVISVAAGVSLSTLASALPRAVVVRAMPNTPALIGRGASAFALAEDAPPRARATAAAILGAVGLAVEVPESAMDAVTALSGSGPAYVFRFLEALISGGTAAGLDPAVARTLALQTLIGAAQLAATGDDPAELRRRVTSPGGTTQAALTVLDGGDFVGLIERAIVRARDRGVELGLLARGERP
jgi:pyrroline-5-carboxylate reductase